MPTIDVRRSIFIAAPAEVVRRQFGDVAHHESTHVHRGVRFEVLDDDGTRCRYRQVTSIGPLRLAQEVDLARTVEGPLVNTIRRGQFEGGTITFDVQPDVTGGSTMEARLHAELTGPVSFAAPLLRRSVARAFDRALDEDRRDLESDSYPAP